jgi:hypothetical protein
MSINFSLPTRTTPKQPLLLSLPREIRDQIYTHVLSSSALQIRPITSNESQQIRTHYQKEKFKHYRHADPCNLLDPHATFAPRVSTIFDTAILLVNTQINEEALQVLYETKTVYLSLYHGCKEGGLLESPRLGLILGRARFLRISTYNLNFLDQHLPVLAERQDVKMLEIGFRTVYGLRWISGEGDKDKVAEYLRPFSETRVRGLKRLSWTLFNSECMNPGMQVLKGDSEVELEVNFAGCFGKVRHCMIE